MLEDKVTKLTRIKKSSYFHRFCLCHFNIDVFRYLDD